MVSSKPSGTPTATAILEAALTQLEERGVLEVRAVAKESGFSRQAIYLHFDGRAGLAIAVADYADAKYGLREQLEATRAATDAETMLAEFASFLARYNRQVYSVIRACDRLRAQDEAIEAAWKKKGSSRRAGCRTMGQKIDGWGRLAAPFTPRTAGDWLFAASSILYWEALVLECGWSQKRFAEMLRESSQRTLLTTTARRIRRRPR